MTLKEGENGLPCRRVRSRLSEGSGEKREENTLNDRHRKWMRECYLCQQLWLLSSKDSPLMTPPISFIYSHLFSCIALPLLFHFVPLPSPPSVFCSVSLFSHFFLSVSCNKRLTERVWRLNEQPQPPHEGREEGDGAGSRRLRKAHRSDNG